MLCIYSSITNSPRNVGGSTTSYTVTAPTLWTVIWADRSTDLELVLWRRVWTRPWRAPALLQVNVGTPQSSICGRLWTSVGNRRCFGLVLRICFWSVSCWQTCGYAWEGSIRWVNFSTYLILVHPCEIIYEGIGINRVVVYSDNM